MTAEILDAALTAACADARCMMPTGADLCAALAEAGYAVVPSGQLDRLRAAVVDDLGDAKAAQSYHHMERRDAPASLDGRIEALERVLEQIDEERTR